MSRWHGKMEKVDIGILASVNRTHASSANWAIKQV